HFEFGDLVGGFHLLLANQVYEVHGYFSLSEIGVSCSISASNVFSSGSKSTNRSGRRIKVARRASFWRQRRMAAWLPSRRTSGTGNSRKTGGRVYCGGPRRPVKNESVSTDSQSPIT